MILEIAPSTMAADASRLGRECRAIEEAGADRVHWDVMDGVFVPNLTFGPDVVKACRRHTSLRFEAHLMITRPDEFASQYVKAGCDTILIHAETCQHLHRSLAAIADTGARAGVAINPHTPVSAISEVIGLVDQILVMTVNPGFGGQSYISSAESKITALRSMIDASGKQIDLEADGGINKATIARAAAAGADVLVAGSAVFGHPDGPARAIEDLRVAAQGDTALLIT